MFKEQILNTMVVALVRLLALLAKEEVFTQLFVWEEVEALLLFRPRAKLFVLEEVLKLQ